MREPTSAGSDRPNRWPWPPLLYAGVLALAALLERTFPDHPLPESSWMRGVGAALFLGGIAIGVLGVLRFRAIDTPIDPTGQARQLSTEGIYAYTRNPMYLGALISFVGLALALRSVWLLVLVAPLAFALTKLAIAPEEAYLERRFGEVYRAYKSRVRRWL